DWRGQAYDGAGLIMVLQVFADARQIGNHGDAVLAQQIGWTDARELQELGGLQSSGRKNDFLLSTSQFLATSLNPIDTDGASTLECDPGRVCPCEDSQIRPRQRGPEECNSRTFSPSGADAELIRADAVSGFAIEIGIVRQAELLSGVDPGPARRMIVAQYRNAQLSVRSAILTRLAIEAFELAEIREHV